jgi:hypothetical protein
MPERRNHTPNLSYGANEVEYNQASICILANYNSVFYRRKQEAE